jgi:membrane protein required for colicin V production
MSIVDGILLVLLGLAAIKGYVKGFIIEIFSFLAFFVGIFVAIEFTAPVSAKYFSDSAYQSLISVAIFAVLFLGLTLAVNLTAKVIKKAVDLTFIGTLDNILGAAVAVLKWALIISVILWILRSVGMSLEGDHVDDSFVFPYVEVLAPTAFGFLADFMPFFDSIFDSIGDFSKEGKWT